MGGNRAGGCNAFGSDGANRMTSTTQNTGGEDYLSSDCWFCESPDRVLKFLGDFEGKDRSHYGIELPMCLDCRDDLKTWIAEQRQRCRDRRSIDQRLDDDESTEH